MARRETPRERLSDRLLEAGYVVHPDDIRPAVGHWRTSPHADVYRWEAVGRGPDGLVVHLGSWDTITDCARTGIVIDATEVSAKRGRSFAERNPRSRFARHAPTVEPVEVADDDLLALERAASEEGDLMLAATCALALGGSEALGASPYGTFADQLRDSGTTREAARRVCGEALGRRGRP